MAKIKVLVIEHFTAVRNTIKKNLEGSFRDIKIVEARNGEEAKRILSKNNIVLIICSWEIPRIKGEDLFFWIRDNPKLFSIPFIFMFSNNDKNIIHKAIQKGATTYLIKPFTGNELIRKVVAVINELDRRQHKRYDIEGDIVLRYNSHIVKGKLRDISLRGLRGIISIEKIEEKYPQILQYVKIELHFGSSKLIDGIEGYVVRLEPYELSIDSKYIVLVVTFLNLTQAKRDELSLYLIE